MTPPVVFGSPPGPNASPIHRRRSQSRTSRGGKPLGPATYTSPTAIRRSGSEQGTDSAISVDSSSLAELIGSFTATREELRDGSARLAAFSLNAPSQPPSPGVGSLGLQLGHSKSTSSVPPHSHSHSPTSPSSFPAGSPSALSRQLGNTHSSPTDNDNSESEPNTPHATLVNLPAASGSSATLVPGGARRGSLQPTAEVSEAGSSSGSAEVTPTQSKMGSLTEEAKAGGLEVPSDDEESHAGSSKVHILGDETNTSDSDENASSFTRRKTRRGSTTRAESAVVDERTPLMPRRHSATPAAGKAPTGRIGGAVSSWANELSASVKGASEKVGQAAKAVTKENVKQVGRESATAVPAVILGVLMNILDGVSYGMIMFPTNVPVFAEFGGIGVSMFFVSCVVSQLVYTGGGSIFKAGNGSMMIEVVPFYHSIVTIISADIADNKDVVATTMLAFAFSSILTGLAFYLLGALRLGRLSEFFPRHILVGCIGGVGAFLFVTGLTVSARLEEVEGISLDLVRHYFDLPILFLWLTPLLLAITLRLITARYSHPLIFPGFFMMIPVVFYGIAWLTGHSVEELREAGWVFEANGVDSGPFEYLTLFDLKKTDFSALISTIPTQLALVFFGLLHVPINVPALGISVGEDNVDTDRELVAHGYSNVLAGLCGTVPNYLCYVNSVLFYKVGGTTRVAGFLLALASFGILLAGPGIISYLPVSVVGALIFILGIDLVKEAIWDTWGRVAKFEYITICVIVLVMTVWDFVAGIAAGIILACVSFVVWSSRRRAIRSILTGEMARSTVRRHPKQSAFLKAVGAQTRVIRLQGFLFFGTISGCEAEIREILESAAWSSNPIRFLVVDFSLANGVDFSGAEAFVRIQRLLEEKGVVLVLCGCSAESQVGLALRSVDLWADPAAEHRVEVFENLNDALEYCENAFLRSLYSKKFDSPQKNLTSTANMSSQIEMPKTELESEIGPFGQSPRASHLRHAAKETMNRADLTPVKTHFKQPLPLLLQSLRPFMRELNEDIAFRMVPYFQRVHVERGTVLFEAEDATDSFYLIESGMLRATYVFHNQTHSITESMVAGTVAGEMTFLSRSKRNATVVAERDSVLWKMDTEAHDEMGRKEGWEFCRKFEQCLMRIATEEQDVLMGHLISSL